jgi:ketosteroid isomerase-like protein
MTPHEAKNVAVVQAYWDACNTGDVDELMATMAPDIVHYFLPTAFRTIHGAEHLAKYWRKYKQNLDPTWRIDHLMARGDEVVIEFSCLWRPPGSPVRLMNRGTEWYRLSHGRITEIRAYFIADPAASAELADFAYAERGYLLDDSSR